MSNVKATHSVSSISLERQLGQRLLVATAQAVLDDRDPDAHAYALELQRWCKHAKLAGIPKPILPNITVLCLCASLVELLAHNAEQAPPPWAHAIGSLPEPLFLFRPANEPANPKELASLTADTAEALRKRNFFVSKDFLGLG